MLVLSAFNVKKIMAAQIKTFHKAFADFATSFIYFLKLYLPLELVSIKTSHAISL